MDIYILGDMIVALQLAQYGDVLLFNIKNNILFTSAVLINKGVTIDLINSSGNESVTFEIINDGNFRHFTTGGASIDNITMIVGPGIILDGGGTGGGIQIYGSSCLLTLNDCGAINCSSHGNGGGISMGKIPGYMPILTITDALISGNIAITDGGGIIAKGSLVSVFRSKITNNSAGRAGGGIFTDQLDNITVDATSAFSGNIAGSYAYWTLTNDGDSNIHRTHIFTDRFSTFVPVQTMPLEVWFFTNAYNNYDINYVREPEKTVTVNFVEADNPSHIFHTTTIESFIGATMTFPPRYTFTDSSGTVWFLQPPDQPSQTVRLTDTEVDYVVTFYYATRVSNVTVTEYYVDKCVCQLMSPTQTIVELGDNYIKTALSIPCYIFVGYRINNGSLQTGEVNIIGIIADTVITFIYIRICMCPCYCYELNPRKRNCFHSCCFHPKTCMCRDL